MIKAYTDRMRKINPWIRFLMIVLVMAICGYTAFTIARNHVAPFSAQVAVTLTPVEGADLTTACTDAVAAVQKDAALKEKMLAHMGVSSSEKILADAAALLTGLPAEKLQEYGVVSAGGTFDPQSLTFTTLDAVLEKVVEVLTHEGAGHTFAIHATDENVVRKFAMKVPVSRFLVNAPAALGGIGAATNLFPALTLGCGSVGGSSSSNNISPMDLLDIRKVAWGKTEPEKIQGKPNEDLIEIITAKILERLK